MSDSFATPWTVTPQAPLSMGFPSKKYWSELPFPFPGDLPEPTSPELADGFFTTEPPGKGAQIAFHFTLKSESSSFYLTGCEVSPPVFPGVQAHSPWSICTEAALTIIPSPCDSDLQLWPFTPTSILLFSPKQKLLCEQTSLKVWGSGDSYSTQQEANESSDMTNSRRPEAMSHHREFALAMTFCGIPALFPTGVLSPLTSLSFHLLLVCICASHPLPPRLPPEILLGNSALPLLHDLPSRACRATYNT